MIGNIFGKDAVPGVEEVRLDHPAPDDGGMLFRRWVGRFHDYAGEPAKHAETQIVAEGGVHHAAVAAYGFIRPRPVAAGQGNEVIAAGRLAEPDVFARAADELVLGIAHVFEQHVFAHVFRQVDGHGVRRREYFGDRIQFRDLPRPFLLVLAAEALAQFRLVPLVRGHGGGDLHVVALALHQDDGRAADEVLDLGVVRVLLRQALDPGKRLLLVEIAARVGALRAGDFLLEISQENVCLVHVVPGGVRGERRRGEQREPQEKSHCRMLHDSAPLLNFITTLYKDTAFPPALQEKMHCGRALAAFLHAATGTAGNGLRPMTALAQPSQVHPLR